MVNYPCIAGEARVYCAEAEKVFLTSSWTENVRSGALGPGEAELARGSLEHDAAFHDKIDPPQGTRVL